MPLKIKRQKLQENIESDTPKRLHHKKSQKNKIEHIEQNRTYRTKPELQIKFIKKHFHKS